MEIPGTERLGLFIVQIVFSAKPLLSLYVQEKMRGQRGRLRALAGICHVHESYFKEARNSFSFFQSNKHILSLDTVRVIILRRNLARVLSTHLRFLTLYFPPK